MVSIYPSSPFASQCEIEGKMIVLFAGSPQDKGGKKYTTEINRREELGEREKEERRRRERGGKDQEKEERRGEERVRKGRDGEHQHRMKR